MRLSEHFTYKKLIKFTIPSIAMMIFTSIYGVVDGYFISNFVGKIPFAAVNLVIPAIMLLGTVGFMFGTGGSALVAKTMGEGEREKANEIFSLLIYFSSVLAIIVSVFGFVFMEDIVILLGGEGELLEDAVFYGRINMIALPAFILQLEFQSFMITAEKPQLGFWITGAAGVTNIVLDALLVAIFDLGILGAALATGLSQAVGGLVPLICFFLPNKSALRLTKTSFSIRHILQTCLNGSSEFMSNISMSVVSMLYNIQLLKYAGENGVAAYGTLMYVSMIFSSIFIGYSIGSAPIISFHFGAGNHNELRGLTRKSMTLVLTFSLLMFAASQLLATPFSKLFVGYDAQLLSLTNRAFILYSFSFLFMGFAIFSSGFFTALNDGITSAIISFLRTMVFQIASVMLLPLIFDIDGIWLSIVFAEVMAVILSAVMLVVKRKKYNY